MALGLTIPCSLVAQTLRLQPPYDATGLHDAWPHSDEIIADAKTRAKHLAGIGGVWSDGRDTYKTELGGQVAYITANNYLPATAASIRKDPNSNKSYPGYCVFYIYNKNIQFESSYTLQLGDGHAGTNCNTIRGVSGVAYHGKPALLAIAQYFYTDTPAASSIAQIGNGWIQTAVLLPLAQQANGQWTFTQDDACFARTNTYKTLAAAKAHLATCQ